MVGFPFGEEGDPAMPRKPRRRRKGTGSIWYAADKRLWVAEIKLQGQRHVWYRPDREEAASELNRFLEKPQPPSGGTEHTLDQYLTRWLEEVVRLSLSPSTFSCYEIQLAAVRKRLGHLLLSEVTPEVVAGLSAWLVGEGGRTTRQAQLGLAALSSALGYAAKPLGLIPVNPCLGIRKPGGKKKPRPLGVWTPEDVLEFFEHSDRDRLAALYRTAAGTGLRSGELLGLAWTDLHLPEGFLQVRRELVFIRGKMLLQDFAKSERGIRRVSLPAFVVQALEQHRQQMDQEDLLNGPVFCDTLGGFLRRSNLRRRSFLPLIQKAGVPLIRFHDLRHTYATLLLAAGENPRVVSESLGHASVAFTLQTYVHSLPQDHRKAAERLDQLLKGDKE